MQIQAFIFNWKGHEARAAALEEKVAKLIDVTIINSEEQLSGDHPGWVHLDDTAYFAAQWNKALELFDADILFHIQADAEFDHFEALFAKAGLLFDKYRIGVYEPNVDYTDIIYDKLKLRTIEPGVFEVPFTDCTCWFIAAEVVRQLPPIDPQLSKYGWGIPRAIAAVSRLGGRLSVRDYNFTIRHPKGRGYSSASAGDQLDNYLASLDPKIRDEISRQEQNRNRLRPETTRAKTLIITAASEAYGPSLLALLGSLNLNWPNHPPVLVYDIGLDATTLNWLKENRVPVKRVPPFCTHWRRHFTWKLWCLNDAPASDILWMDAGLLVLQPVDEILDTLDRQGYFLSTNYESLEWEASDEACRGCGVPNKFREGKLSLPGGLMGFRKTGKILKVLEEALSVALVEKNIAATAVAHRFDQAIISLLMYKHLSRIMIADGTVYLGALSPRQIPGQKIWVHRTRILMKDVEHLAAHITAPGDPYMPDDPFPLNRAKALANLYRVYWHFGKGELIEARENLDMAFRVDPALKNEIELLAGRLNQYRHQLVAFLGDSNGERDFIGWALKQLKVINGAPFVSKLTVSLQRTEPVEISHSSGMRI
jgi:hypothetical protein